MENIWREFSDSDLMMMQNERKRIHNKKRQESKEMG